MVWGVMRGGWGITHGGGRTGNSCESDSFIHRHGTLGGGLRLHHRDGNLLMNALLHDRFFLLSPLPMEPAALIFCSALDA